MCKKLMFLISLVCLLGLTGTAFSEDCGDGPEYCVESGDSVTISGNVTVDKGFYIGEGGTLTIEGTLTCLGDDYRPTINGGTLIIDGGTLNLPVRMNIGQGDGGTIYIINGGTLLQWDGGGKDSEEGIKFPDDDDGDADCRIYVIDGTLEAVLIEWKEAWDDGGDAKFFVGCNGTITVGETDDDSQDPQKWYDEGDLNCDASCSGILTITDLGDDVKEVICLLLGPEAWKPNPKDGATGEAAVDCDMVLSWRIGNCIIDTKGRSFVYFSTDENCVETAPAVIRPALGGDPPCYVAKVNTIDLDPLPAVDLQQTYTWNAGSLPLWTKYYWRVDQGCSDATVVKGNIWSFTTGCPLIPGDANLDCIVNFLDYAEVAGTWMGQQYFPDGCTP